MASPGVLPSFEFNATYVHSLRQRDPATEEHFVSHFSPMLLRKLRKHLRSTELARELRQETFLRVLTFLRSNQSIRDPERFEYFVLGVCNNVLHETYRRQKKVAPLDPELDVVSNAPGPDARAMAAERADRVQRMLSGLSPRARAILKATFLEEKDRDEICVKFGVNRNHLRLLICRAKKTLSRCAREQMSKKSAVHLRRSSRSKRRTLVQVISSRPSSPKSAISRPATVFLPPLHATNVPTTAGTWL
ncbi:MAG: sigma-70 family RNA polymerase sigma factor [Acidobacteriia bacterium]|nr:sigma-70 family RNA polymerase sigma factor [Terriglobia bacterium]